MAKARQNPTEHSEVDVDSMTTEQVKEAKSKISENVEFTFKPPVEKPESKAESKPEIKETPPVVKAEEKPEEKPAEKKLDEDGQEVADTVPHGRFEHERKRRKEAEAKEKELRENHVRLEERTRALLTVLQNQAQEQPQPKQAPPSKQEDPLAYLDYLEGEVANLRQHQQQEAQRRSAEEAWQKAYMSYNADINRVSREKADFKEASAYLVESRRQELEAFGVTGIEQQMQDITAMERQIIAYAMQNRRSPAELLYELAEKRGYRKAAPEQSKAPPPVDIDAVAKKTSAAVIDQITKREDARQAAMSLSGSGAPVASGDLTPEDLLNMTDEQFDAYKKKMGSKAMRAPFGLH